ncbi:MAG TPA: hypothetical protein VNQ73_01365 [Ilumatobacter sp.]|nr:hypothetical protein [Ilumatobacter sp.]
MKLDPASPPVAVPRYSAAVYASLPKGWVAEEIGQLGPAVLYDPRRYNVTHFVNGPRPELADKLRSDGWEPMHHNLTGAELWVRDRVAEARRALAHSGRGVEPVGLGL